VKNRIVTKGKPTAEILHFVQNDIFFFCHFRLFENLFSLGSTNDKQKKHPPALYHPYPPPPAPSKGGE